MSIKCFLTLLPLTLAQVELKNANMAFMFADMDGNITLLSANSTGKPSSLVPGGFAELWQLQLLTTSGYALCSPSDATSSAMNMTSASTATLTWHVNCSAGARFEVTQTWSLAPGASAASVGVAVMPVGDVRRAGLWAVTVAIGAIRRGGSFFPVGFGQTQAQGYGSTNGRYPSGGCTMQFMAAWGAPGDGHANDDGNGAADSEGGGGMYFAAHDAAAHMKYLYAHEHPAAPRGGAAAASAAAARAAAHLRPSAWSRAAFDTDGQAHAHAQAQGAGQVPAPDCITPLAPHGFPYVGGPARTQSLTLTTLVEGAGQFVSNVTGYRLPFELAVAPLAPPTPELPAWFAASQIYRGWALPSAQWTRKGPVRARPDDFPPWYLDLNVWVNTGWQCLDRFNDTQGDPPTALRNALAVKRRFNISGQGLGLHWYEWQCGFADNCTANHGARRFKFDTQYPDYFPARRGESFRDAVDALRAEGIFTFPYINGRIFDTSSSSFQAQGGASKVVRQPASPALDPRGGGGVAGALEECKSYFGSHELNGSNVYFDVADPTLEYWQDKYAQTVGRLVNEAHVSGVYIDQLCAASPVADFTARGQHGAGGGAWWRQGLVRLLAKAHAQQPAARRAPLVTESNSEFLLDEVQGLLTLVAFGVPFAPPPAGAPSPGHRVLAPAFAAVYGGYYVAFGAVYTHNDLALDPNVFASRLATSFVYGAQMGWFSLGGVFSGPDLDTTCGPMHTLEQFLSPERDAEVAFLRTLAAARGAMQRYFVHGRLAAPVRVQPPPRTFMAPAQAVAPRNPGPFPTLSSAVWYSEHDATLCVFLVTSTPTPVQAALELDMAGTYGFAGGAFDVFLHCKPTGCSAPHSCSAVTGQCSKAASGTLSKEACEAQCSARPAGSKPVVIVPGIVGSNIEAKLDKPSVPQPLCHQKSDWYYLWLESYEVAPDAVQCMFDNLKLKHSGDGNVTNNDGVTTRVPDYGGVGGVRCAMPATDAACNSTVNWGMAIDALVAAGLTPGADLVSAPYDFRFGPKTWLGREYPQLKALVEKTYASNGNRSVVLASISLGGPYLHLFLTQYVDAAWKDQHIDSWLSMSSLWNGATQVAQMLTAGLGWDGITWIKPQAFRDGVRNWPAMAFMLPFSYYAVNGSLVDPVHVSAPARTYKASEMHDALLDASLPDTAAILKSIAQYRGTAAVVPPGVKTFCWYGTEVPTTDLLSFNSSDLSDYGALTMVQGSGDGTVQHASLRLCEDWVGGAGPVTSVKKWKNVTHTGMLTEPAVLEQLVAIATGTSGGGIIS
eukprot:g1008.t1